MCVRMYLSVRTDWKPFIFLSTQLAKKLDQFLSYRCVISTLSLRIDIGLEKRHKFVKDIPATFISF